jgi:hypothetical protein
MEKHNPRQGPQSRPNPDGWQGGNEDFETVWTMFGQRVAPTDPGDMSVQELAKLERGHQRICDRPGFGGA